MFKKFLSGTRSISRQHERGYGDTPWVGLLGFGAVVTVVGGLVLFNTFLKFTRVDQGYVGLKIDLYGNERDEPEVLPPGGVWYGLGETVVEFPTFEQYTVLTANTQEGSPNDDSISFNVNGANVNADVSFNYRIPSDSVPAFYSAYRTSPEEFKSTRVRSTLRSCFNRHGSTYQPADMYGARLNDLLLDVTNCFNNEFETVPVSRFDANGRAIQVEEELGITISNLGLIGSPRLPQPIQNALNQRLERQEAVASEQAETERQRQVLLRQQEAAEAAAQVAVTEAEAAAEVARLEAQSIQGENLAKQALERWDGSYPDILVIGDVPAGFDFQQILPAIGGADQ